MGVITVSILICLICVLLKCSDIDWFRWRDSQLVEVLEQMFETLTGKNEKVQLNLG